jgi:hypothetical protein
VIRRLVALILIGGALLVSRAALWDEWVDEDPLAWPDIVYSQNPAPSGGGSAVDGVPLLTDVLTDARLVVLIRFGSTWTDVTTDVQYLPQPLSIAPGRPNESGVAPPAKASLTLLNPDRRYSQFDPLSPNWPYVRENAILWVRVFVGGQYFTRFYGEIKGFKQGHDLTGRYSIVSVTAAGITQRLGLRTAPLKSPLTRAISRATPQPAAYWALEDGVNTTAPAPATSGTQAGSTSGTGVKFGSEGPVGSVSGMELISTTRGSSAFVPTSSVTFPLSVASGSTFVGLSFWFKCDPLANAQSGLSEGYASLAWMNGVGGDINSIFIEATNGPSSVTSPNVHVWIYSGSTYRADLQPFTPTIVDPLDGEWHNLQVRLTQSGGNVVVDLYYDNVKVATTTLVGRTIGSFERVNFPGVGAPTTTSWGAYYRDPAFVASDEGGLPVNYGQLAVWTDATMPNTYQAGLGYVGESPYDRLVRVCAEEGIPFETVGYYVSSVTMGPQGVDSLMNIIRECELADAGFLYDGLSEGLQLQGISQRYDQFSRLTVAGDAGELKPPFEPLPDDYGRINRMTVRRKNGSSATVEDTDGPLGKDAVGLYDASLPQPVNYEDDSLLTFRAAWEVHKGSGRPGFRYPSVTLNLRDTPSLIYSNSVTGWLTVIPGLMLTVTQPFTAQNPGEDIRLCVEGWTETITPKSWEVTANCSRQDVYDVFKIEDSTLGRLRGGQTLAGSVGIGASALSVATPAGEVLTTTTATNPVDFPLYIEVSGIKVKVTGIAGTSSPQTFTVDPTTVTKNLNAGDSVAPWRPGVIAL